MRKFRIVALSGLLSIVGLAVQAQTSTAFAADNCRCKITFPDRPELEKEVNDGFTSNRAMAVVDEQLFFLDYATHVADIKESDWPALAEVSLKSFAESMGGTVTKTKTWKLKGKKGLKSRIEDPAKGIVAYYYVIGMGSLQYQIAVFAEGEPDKKMRKKFLKSFKRL